MFVKKYRKKPVQIEAFQWHGLKEEIDMIKGWTNRQSLKYNFSDHSIKIPTPEGDMKANLGDMIIKGVKGEVYPCKKDIFDLTYDPV